MCEEKKKICFKCGIEKPLSEFYKHPQMSDGHVNKCIECNKKDVIQNRELRKEYYHAYDRVRGKTKERRDSQNSNSKKYKLKIQESKKLWRNRNPEKYHAHRLVDNAIRGGRLLKQPCEVCGATEDVEAHHADYSKPLDVRWLCYIHHNELHRKYDLEEDLKILEETVKGSYWDHKEENK